VVRKILILMFLFLGFSLSAPGALAGKSDVYILTNINRDKYVMRLDLEKGKLEKFFKYKEPYMCFSIGENGKLYFSTTGGFDYLSRELFVVDQLKKKRSGKIKIRGKGTLRNFVVGDHLFVVNEFSDRRDLGDNSSIEIYNANTLEYQKTIYFPHKGQRLGAQLCLTPDKKKIYVVTWSAVNLSKFGQGSIYRIDVETGKIDQSFGPYDSFCGARDIAVDKRGKIYISASYKEPGKYVKTEDCNTNILVFSPVSGKLINRISVGFPEGLVYVALVDKLYVKSSLPGEYYLNIIDCEKQKRISRIPGLLIHDFAYGGRGRLVATFKNLSDEKECVGILDVETDKFIKKIELKSSGKRISFNPYAE